MVLTPPWLAASSGSTPQAAQINQFLGSHVTQQLYTGTQTSAQTTVGTGSTSTNGLYLAQSFTTTATQTAVGYVTAYITPGTATSGTQLGPTTLSLHANSAGAPAATALQTVTMTAEYVTSAPLMVTFPLPATGLTSSSTYWLVLAAAGNATYSYQWNKSNQTSGASTSPDGVTWTAQAYGFVYTVNDQAVTGLLQCSWEDSGVRWTWRGYGTGNMITQYAEYTAGQTSSGYSQSFSNLTYTNGRLFGAV